MHFVSTPGFDAEYIDEDPATFHARPFDEASRSLWIPRLSEHETLVLGSSQKPDTVDIAALREQGVDLAGRRSGGGAVLVSRADLVWFDVVLPGTDPLWTADVGRSFDWLGDVCQRALAELGVDTELYGGRLQHSPWSRRICFAGLGPGELTVGGKKLVGMSQRRTRTAARLQVAILRRWDGPRHASLLALPEHEREQAAKDLSNAATGIPHAPEAIHQAIQTQLATL